MKNFLFLGIIALFLFSCEKKTKDDFELKNTTWRTKTVENKYKEYVFSNDNTCRWSINSTDSIKDYSYADIEYLGEKRMYIHLTKDTIIYDTLFSSIDSVVCDTLYKVIIIDTLFHGINYMRLLRDTIKTEQDRLEKVYYKDESYW